MEHGIGGADERGGSCPLFNVNGSALPADKTRLITRKRTHIGRTGRGCWRGMESLVEGRWWWGGQNSKGGEDNKR